MVGVHNGWASRFYRICYKFEMLSTILDTIRCSMEEKGDFPVGSLEDKDNCLKAIRKQIHFLIRDNYLLLDSTNFDLEKGKKL